MLLRYVNRDREITRKYVQHAEARGVKALFITVDAPQLGRREKDMRMKFVGEEGVAKVQDGQSGIKKDEGVARAISVSSVTASHERRADHPGTCASRSLIRVSPGRTSRGSRASRRASVLPRSDAPHFI